MAQIRTGHMESDGNAINLDLGFIPNYFEIHNLNAAAGEIECIKWFGSEMGNAKEIQYDEQADSGTVYAQGNYVSSGGLISAYDATTINTTNPVAVTGGKGVTIGANFSDDSDELFYIAVQSDRDTDHGDINA